MSTEAMRLANEWRTSMPEDVVQLWAPEAAAELRRLSASDQAQRNALAAIYQALGTSNPDMTAWPAEIRELRRLSAENEKLKTVPMKYRRMEFNAQLQAENDALHEEIRELRNTIAAQAECIKANNDERQEWQREVVSLRAEAARKEEVMSTHGPNCYSWGPGHYECAMQEIGSLLPDAERWQYAKATATQQADALGPIFRIDIRRTSVTLYHIDAAVDAAIKDKKT